MDNTHETDLVKEHMLMSEKYSKRMYYLAILLSALVFASIVNNNMIVRNTCEAMEKAVVEITNVKAEETKEIVRLYFETDYLYPEQSIEQHNEMKVNE